MKAIHGWIDGCSLPYLIRIDKNIQQGIQRVVVVSHAIGLYIFNHI